MRLVPILIVLATLATPAAAQLNAGQECGPQYSRLGRLVQKLRVRPVAPGAVLSLKVCGGGEYAILDMFEALVDRMDQAAAIKAAPPAAVVIPVVPLPRPRYPADELE